MSTATHAYLTTKGIDFDFINDGDDGVIFMEKEDLHEISDLRDWFSKLGYTMQVESPVYELEKVEFCQCKPVYEGDGYIMCRDPFIAMSKDPLTFKSVRSLKEWNYQRRAISDCGLSLAGHLPVLGQFYKALGRGVPETTRQSRILETGMQYLAKGMQDRSQEGNWGISTLKTEDDKASLEARVRISFYKAFNMSPLQQKDLEQYFQGISPTYFPIFSPSINYNTKTAYIEHINN
jgi:hypothetical protein